MPKDRWFVTCFPIVNGGDKHKNFRDTKQNQLLIKKFRQYALNQRDIGVYAHRFKRTSYLNDAMLGLELEVKKLFESDSLLKLVNEITGKNFKGVTGFFSSCYENGDFLSKYRDRDDELVFIFYLTKNWQNDWGGEFEFSEMNSSNSIYSFPPGFNQLFLFSAVDMPVSIYHEVKMISENASKKRIAFTGAFK